MGQTFIMSSSNWLFSSNKRSNILILALFVNVVRFYDYEWVNTHIYDMINTRYLFLCMIFCLLFVVFVIVVEPNPDLDLADTYDMREPIHGPVLNGLNIEGHFESMILYPSECSIDKTESDNSLPNLAPAECSINKTESNNPPQPLAPSSEQVCLSHELEAPSSDQKLPPEEQVMPPCDEYDTVAKPFTPSVEQDTCEPVLTECLPSNENKVQNDIAEDDAKQTDESTQPTCDSQTVDETDNKETLIEEPEIDENPQVTFINEKDVEQLPPEETISIGLNDIRQTIDPSVFYIAMRSHEPEEDDEVMSLHEGELVEKLGDEEGESLWRIRKEYDGREGLVPSGLLQRKAQYEEALQRKLQEVILTLPSVTCKL